MIRLQTVLSCRGAQGTTRPGLNVIQRVGAAAGAQGFVPDVLGTPEEVCVYRGITIDLLLFQGPGGLRAVHLLEVGNAGGLLAGGPRLHEVRDGDGGQEADDCDHNHDFNQGETAIAAECS